VNREVSRVSFAPLSAPVNDSTVGDWRFGFGLQLAVGAGVEAALPIYNDEKGKRP